MPGGLSGVIAIAAGAYHSLALKQDGTVAAWGANDSGQGTVPPELSGGEVVAIAAGDFHSLALKQDGTVVAWGAGGPGQSGVPNYGQATVPGGLTERLPSRQEGITAWRSSRTGRSSRGAPAGLDNPGDPNYGQATVPPDLSGSGVTAIAAGGYHSLALRQNGTVVAWGAGGPGQTGDPNYGQTVVPPDLSASRVIAIAAGGYHSLALVGPRAVQHTASDHRTTRRRPRPCGNELHAFGLGEPAIRR